MEFFIPGTRDLAEAESVLASICAIVRESTGSPAKTRIHSLEFNESGYRAHATVGCEFEYEVVSCIVETRDAYQIFTPNRGLRRGNPTRIDKGHVIKASPFANSISANAPISRSARRKVLASSN